MAMTVKGHILTIKVDASEEFRSIFHVHRVYRAGKRARTPAPNRGAEAKLCLVGSRVRVFAGE